MIKTRGKALKSYRQRTTKCILVYFITSHWRYADLIDLEMSKLRSWWMKCFFFRVCVCVQENSLASFTKAAVQCSVALRIPSSAFTFKCQAIDRERFCADPNSQLCQTMTALGTVFAYFMACRSDAPFCPADADRELSRCSFSSGRVAGIQYLYEMKGYSVGQQACSSITQMVKKSSHPSVFRVPETTAPKPTTSVTTIPTVLTSSSPTTFDSTEVPMTSKTTIWGTPAGVNSSSSSSSAVVLAACLGVGGAVVLIVGGLLLCCWHKRWVKPPQKCRDIWSRKVSPFIWFWFASHSISRSISPFFATRLQKHVSIWRLSDLQGQTPCVHDRQVFINQCWKCKEDKKRKERRDHPIPPLPKCR